MKRTLAQEIASAEANLEYIEALMAGDKQPPRGCKVSNKSLSDDHAIVSARLQELRDREAEELGRAICAAAAAENNQAVEGEKRKREEWG